MARSRARRLKSNRPNQRLAAIEPLEDRRLLAVMGADEVLAISPLDRSDPLATTSGFLARGGGLSYGAVFNLQSKPDSDFTIYLDFDGHVTEGTSWNSNYGISSIVSPPFDLDGDPTGFAAVELDRILSSWQRTAEDFAPFDINVTTRDPGVEALRNTGGSDTAWGARAIVTDDTFANCGCGGFAFLNTFDDSIDTPTFVFNQGPGSLGETFSHEVGHMLGLRHDGTSSGGLTYYGGHGSGTTGWGSIMGAPFTQNVTMWDRGEYFDRNNTENDLNIITTQNGPGYRVDDYGNSLANAEALQIEGDTLVHGFGIIERNTDLDVFSFETGSGTLSLDIQPLSERPNLDVWAGLYDAGGSLVTQSNPSDVLSTSLTASVAAGTYFVKVDGVGKYDVYNPVTDTVDPPPNPAPWTTSSPDGYSDYGSLGQYAISGTIVAAGSDTFSIAATDAVKTEGAVGQVPLTFTVTRSGNLGSPASVDYSFVANLPDTVGDTYQSQADAADFAAGTQLSGTISFLANEPSQTITLNVTGDNTPEDDEYFDIVLSNPTAGWKFGDNQATGVILSDESSFGVAPTATSGDVNEGPYSGALLRWRQITAASGQFDEWALDNVSLTNSTFGDDFDPDVDSSNWSEIRNGTANNIFGGSGNSLFFSGTPDRWATSPYLAVQPGETLSFDIIYGDGSNGGENADDGDDVVLEYSLDGGSNWSLVNTYDTEDYTTWTTIQETLPADIDTNPPGTISYLLVREGGSAESATIDWEVESSGAAGSADAADFPGGVFPTGQVNFAAGEFTAQIVVPVNGDTEFESDEDFVVRLTSVSGNGVFSIPPDQSTATGTIINDDAGYEVEPATKFRWRQLANSAGNFDNWGLDNVSVTAGNFADDFDASVDSAQWDSIVGGAANANFGGTGNSLFFTGDNQRVAESRIFRAEPGDLLTFDIIYGDDNNGGENPEDGEDVVLEYSLDNGSTWVLVDTYDHAVLTTWTTIQTAIPTLPDVAQDEGNVGTTTFSFDVGRYAFTSGPSNVNWQIVGSGANPADADDFVGGVLPSGNLTFAPGETLRTVDIEVVADTTFEPDEMFEFMVVGGSGPTALATILNDDSQPDGDFNGDGLYDCLDIDALVDNIANQTGNLTYDLTGDGALDNDDLLDWLAIAGSVNLASGNAYLVGDANLDGVVDVSDFNIFNSNKFTNDAGWCRGDFNADGVVDVSDFNLWNTNKFQSSLAAAEAPVNEVFAVLVQQLTEDHEEAKEKPTRGPSYLDRVFANY